MPERYSRHYYDLAMMARSKVKDKALGDLKLLQRVVAFNKQFFASGWARDDLARPGTMRLLPPEHVEKVLREDYGLMQHMLFAEKPSFDEIISELRDMETRINKVAK